LQSQLAELLNRLEQESKAFQKVNDERRQYLAEINAAKMAAETFQRRQQQQSDDEGAFVKAATPGYETRVRYVLQLLIVSEHRTLSGSAHRNNEETQIQLIFLGLRASLTSCIACGANYSARLHFAEIFPTATG